MPIGECEATAVAVPHRTHNAPGLQPTSLHELANLANTYTYTQVCAMAVFTYACTF